MIRGIRCLWWRPSRRLIGGTPFGHRPKNSTTRQEEMTVWYVFVVRRHGRVWLPDCGKVLQVSWPVARWRPETTVGWKVEVQRDMAWSVDSIYCTRIELASSFMPPLVRLGNQEAFTIDQVMVSSEDCFFMFFVCMCFVSVFFFFCPVL